MNFRPAREVFKEFTALLGKYVSPYNKQDKYTIVGYNAYFDTEQLREWWILNGDKFYGSWFNSFPIDVIIILRFLLNKVLHTFPNMKLGTVYDCLIKLGILDKLDNVEQFHNAMYDITITRHIYNQVILPCRDQFIEIVTNRLKGA